MPAALYTHLRPEVGSVRYRDGNIEILTTLGTLRFSGGAACQLTIEALHRGAIEGELWYTLVRSGGEYSLAVGLETLETCRRQRLLDYRLKTDTELWATLQEMVPADAVVNLPRGLDTKLCLSRFVYLRSVDGCMTVESPLSLMRVRLQNERSLAMLGATTSAISLGELTERLHSWPEGCVLGLVELLYRGGMLISERQACLERTPPLGSWDFHDLVFHSRSRRGRHDYASGGTYRFREKSPALPARRESQWPGPTIPLCRPDVEALHGNGELFLDVVENRRSVRLSGQRITLVELGEFLYRSARVRELSTEYEYETTDRPYPSAGACYELELYILAFRCLGLKPDLYHYCPFEHHLSGLTVPEEILQAGYDAPISGERSDVIIVMSARFQRTNWKYEGIAYANVLKNAGVLLQNFYLVATAMGLSPCAIGGGDSRWFSRATGNPFEVESSVAEFALCGRS